MLSYDEFIKLLKNKEKILIVTHRNADVDSISSASLLRSLLTTLNPKAEVKVLFPKGVSSKALKIQNFLNLDFASEISEPERFDLIVFLDIGGESVLEEAASLLELKTSKVLIDHHLHDNEFLNRFDLAIINRDFSSTCEIIYDLIKFAGLNIDSKNAYSLAAGILVETRFLQNVKCNTFSVLGELCKNGINMLEVRKLLGRERDFSEKVAILKGLKRMEIYRANDRLFVFSKLGAYRSETASLLMSIGVDFIAIGSELDGECKVHLRLSERLINEIGVNAGRDLVSLINEEFGGVGGGHNQIATVTVKKSLESVFDFLLNFLKERFRERFSLQLIKLE